MVLNLKNQAELINTIQRAIPDEEVQTIVCRAVQHYYKVLFEKQAMKPMDVLETPVLDEGGKKVELEAKQLTIKQIAKVAHEVNRAYCLSLGDDSQLPWNKASKAIKDSAIAGVEMHRANPDAGPEISHESWMEQKLGEGWSVGPVKDEKEKTHPCLVAYEKLPVEQRAKDYIFKAICDQLNKKEKNNG